jgi:hypothetical protein
VVSSTSSRLSSNVSSTVSTATSQSNLPATIRIVDPYTCGGKITGNISGGTGNRVVTVKLTRPGQTNPAYTFNPLVDSNGNWEIIIDYNSVISGTYDNNYSVVDSLNQSASGTYRLEIKKPGECTTVTPSTTGSNATNNVVLTLPKTNSTNTTTSAVPNAAAKPTESIFANAKPTTTIANPAQISQQLMDKKSEIRDKNGNLIRTGGQGNQIQGILMLILLFIPALMFYKANTRRFDIEV